MWEINHIRLPIWRTLQAVSYPVSGAVCAPIAPYTEMRRAVRANIEQYGAFIEIYVSTPLDVCEARDRKGLYAKARKGIIPEFTGISDPYEEPEKPEIRINTADMTPMQAAGYPPLPGPGRLFKP